MRYPRTSNGFRGRSGARPKPSTGTTSGFGRRSPRPLRWPCSGSASATRSRRRNLITWSTKHHWAPARGLNRKSGDLAMTTEFIYEKSPYPSCHASTIVEAEPGRFLAAWFGGSREGADDVAIWLSRYDGRWSEPEKVASEPGKPCWNPVLFRERKTGEIQLYYKAGPSPDTWSGFVRTSADRGATFGEPRILPA